MFVKSTLKKQWSRLQISRLHLAVVNNVDKSFVAMCDI